MKLRFLSFLCPLILGVSTLQAQHKTVTIAAVNNPDMIELKKLSAKFEQENPDITLQWVIVEENILRQRVTTDVSTGSGQFDLVFIGLYETPIFAKRGWLHPIEGLSSEYDLEDVFKSIRDGLSYDGKLYALPFYGESSFLIYRKDFFEQKGLKMPDQPTYVHALRQQVAKHGLRVGEVSPGIAITPLLNDWPPENLKKLMEGKGGLEPECLHADAPATCHHT
jgi:sorbitol/mannitol transport system substrate-binding protein